MKAVAEDADVSYSLPDVVSMKEAAQQVTPGVVDDVVGPCNALASKTLCCTKKTRCEQCTKVGICCLVITARDGQHKDSV